jgi:dienelactone hydrolase
MRTAWRGAIAAFAAAGVMAAAATCADGLPAELRAAVDYDRQAPINATCGAPTHAWNCTWQRVEFDSPRGGRVTGLLIKPKGVARPAVVLSLHGAGQSKSFTWVAAGPLIERGYAVLGLDAALHGDRKGSETAKFRTDLMVTQKVVLQTVVDYRRAMDYLATRKDVGGTAFGVMGLSMGAVQGAILAAADDRVAAALLVSGGGDLETYMAHSSRPGSREALEALAAPGMKAEAAKMDPVNYVAYIRPRVVWFLNGRRDTVCPPEAAQALHAAARDPKRVIWYDGGHLPPSDVAKRVVDEWIDQALRPSIR